MKKEFLPLPLTEIIPYENNPRHNDEAMYDVEESMEQCGYLDPIEVDENNVILSGHTRLKALQRRGATEAEVIRYTGLTEEQKRKYRLLANKTGEKATWDLDLLEQELKDLDFDGYDFGFDDFEMPEEEKPEKKKPEVDFAEVLNEENNYIILKFKTDIDWLNAQTVFGIEQGKSYSTRNDGKVSDKMNRIGIARVLDGEKVVRMILGEV